MVTPVHIPNPEVKAKSPREQELENVVLQWQEAYKELQTSSYIDSLSDDKNFRVELLKSINNLTDKFEKFLDKLEQVSK